MTVNTFGSSLGNALGNALGKTTPQDFLDKYWQKKPLFIPKAFPDFKSPITADELAGLSLEEEVESRIILEHGNTPWELRQGPFSEDSYSTLPDNHWTLLVQAVNHWVPEVQALLKHFNFIPNWRLDDIMISYATDGGNVGPHYDQYDVFLLQAEGKRHWQVGPVYNEQAPTVSGTPLHILSEFTVEEEYILEPGDMLYLPPGVGHHGIAQGECMTISIGFRAPSHSEILMQFTDFIADQLPAHLRYSDPDLSLPATAADINDETLDRLQEIITHYTSNRQLLSEWFGQYITQTKYEENDDSDDMEWQEIIAQLNGVALEVNSAARIASRSVDNQVLFFANGKQYRITTEREKQFVQQLCSDNYLPFNVWSSASDQNSQTLILRLLETQVLVEE